MCPRISVSQNILGHAALKIFMNFPKGPISQCLELLENFSDIIFYYVIKSLLLGQQCFSWMSHTMYMSVSLIIMVTRKLRTESWPTSS